MEIAKKFLNAGQPELALERLKKILQENIFDEWQVHELIGLCFHDLADAEGAAKAYFNAALTDKFLRNQREHFSNFLFATHYFTDDAKILSDNAKIYNSLYRDAINFPAKNNFDKKIHVGFIATHFLDSSSARFYEILLTNYDRKKFFVSAWSLSGREDNFTKKIQNQVDKYFDVSEISFEEIAEKIFAENVEILIDLCGHSDGGETLQILSYRPARIQISAIGYFDTTGADFVDYFLSDKFLLGENKFTEKILLVENLFAFQPNDKMIQAKNLKKILHENFVFGCLNNFMKITEEYLQCVKKILDATGGKIIFRDTTPLESRKKSLEEKILRAGIKNFEVRKGAENFFDDYCEIDLILDTFPYNGGMMSALAIYFEVEVLSKCGKNFHGRMCADILKNCGLEENIATSAENFVEKAIKISRESRKKIFARQLFDAEKFAKNFYAKIADLSENAKTRF